MDTSTDLQAARDEARRQVRGIRAFYIHAAVYAAVIVMLGLINLSTGDAAEGNWWVQWPAMTWGVLVAVHGVFALKGSAVFGPEWEERKVEELMRKRGQR